MTEKNTSSLSYPIYPSRTYLWPTVNHQYRDATVYIANKAHYYFYDTYSHPIDKDYYLTLYDERMDQPPHPLITERWGEDWGYLYNAIKGENAMGLAAKLIFTGGRAADYPSIVKKHHIQFWNLVYMDILSPSPFNYMDVEYGTWNDELLQALCDLPYKEYMKKKVIKRLLKICYGNEFFYILHTNFQHNLSRVFNNHKDKIALIDERVYQVKSERVIPHFW